MTVVVLAALGVGTGAYALWHLPDTSMPKPSTSSVEIDFAAGHPARSPMTVGVRLMEDTPGQYTKQHGVVLAVDLTGDDFAHADWSIVALVPKGVHVGGTIGSDPRRAKVTQF